MDTSINIPTPAKASPDESDCVRITLLEVTELLEDSDGDGR